MGGGLDNARRITCAIAIHNAQSVSRTETETSLSEKLKVKRHSHHSRRYMNSL